MRDTQIAPCPTNGKKHTPNTPHTTTSGNYYTYCGNTPPSHKFRYGIFACQNVYATNINSKNNRTMKHKGKIFVLLCTLCACSLFTFAKDVTFTPAEIVAGTTKDGITVSTDFAIKAGQQICYDKNAKEDIVEIKNTPTTADLNYVEIKASVDMKAISFRGSYNSSGSAQNAAIIYWNGPMSTTSYDNKELAPFVGYDSDCSSNHTNIAPPAGTRTVRLYRQLKKVADNGVLGSGSNYGSGKTIRLAGITVTIDGEGGGEVTPPSTTEPAITAFTVNGVKATINQADKTITATLAEGTNLTSLTPTVSISNADSYTPQGAQNFTNPVTYTVTKGTQNVTYTVTLTAKTPTTPDTPPAGGDVPATKLTIHEPEIYETPKPLGGWGSELTHYNGREYETYYMLRYKPASSTIAGIGVTNNGNGYVITDPNISGADVNFEALDGWLKGVHSGSTGGDDGALEAEVPATEEFAAMPGFVKMKNNNYIEMHIQGYDQFRVMGDDNNATESKGKHLIVYIDGEKQPMTLSTEFTVRTFNITTGEHLIRVEAVGGSNCAVAAFSLRLSNEARVKHLDGNDSTQVVYQTQKIAPVRYALRNQGSLALTWEGAEATGITLSPNATGDTVTLSGTANAPSGKYTYKITALNPQGNPTHSLTGTFTITTQVVGPDTINVDIDDAMRTVAYYCYANDLNDVTLTWKAGAAPAGIRTSTDNTAHLLLIEGTPTVAGKYEFTITVKGGNTIHGVLIVNIPAPSYTIDSKQSVVRVKAGTAIYPEIVWTVKFASNVTVSGLPQGVTGTFKDTLFTISGTPATQTSYPKEYTYTLTSTSAYDAKLNNTMTGKIIVLDPNAKLVLYLYKTKPTDPDAIEKHVGDYYSLTARQAENNTLDPKLYKEYSAVIISETVDATNPEVIDIIQNIDIPVLSFKSFTYSKSRLNWGLPDNGAEGNTDITIKQASHPIFKGMNLKENDVLSILSAAGGRSIQPADVYLQGSICVAIAPKRSDDMMATAIHDVPGKLRKAGFNSRYILLPISSQSYAYFNTTTHKLIDNALAYLTNQAEQQFAAPSLEIRTFTVNGKAATINQNSNTITLVLNEKDADTSALTPVLTLAGTGVEVTPANGETVDFSNSYRRPVEYIVSDMIQTRTYRVSITTPTDLENSQTEEIYFDGHTIYNPAAQMIYLYNVSGVRVAASNTDINMSSFPQGIYLIQTSNNTLKIIK